MKTAVLCFAVLGCAMAVPNGYYHQEYNYKTSSSSFKNNQLQHKTDDQGYYKKDGDLEGRVDPVVDANSEHSEYVNPNSRNDQYHTGMNGGGGDMTSYGHMRANNGFGADGYSSEGLAHSDHISGNTGGYSDYSGTYGSNANSYGSNSQSYGVTSNLRAVTGRLQQDLESDLQNAIYQNKGYSQYSGISFNELERELRRNLTERLNTEIMNRYGQQNVRNGMSYTMSGGRIDSTANYDNQELADLRQQLENSLLNRLRTDYKQRYGSSSRYESHQETQSNYAYTSTTLRPMYYPTYPEANNNYRPYTTIRPVYPSDYTNSNYQTIQSNVRYTPVPNPESITSIASRVQSQLDGRLNELLDEAQKKYFSSSSSYALTNTDVVLERLRDELRSNLTNLLEEDIRRNYGSQIQRDGHMFTVGTNGQTSTQQNYDVHDLENLRSQIERNLIQKLNRDFETYKSRWSSHQTYNQVKASNINYGDYSTPRYSVNPSYGSDVEQFSTRPTSSHLYPLITSGGSTNDNRYNYIEGSRQRGYEIKGASSGSISQLQRQLQNDLSRQLQLAISKGHYGSYSSSGSYNPQSYQVSLQQLSDELNRNLTRQLQEYGASSSYSTYGSFDDSQMANLRSQLQGDLMRQLQQGLQQSYHASSSYSSSSSSNSNYRPVRGSDNYQLGQFRSGGSVALDGEDCDGTHRMKRSYGSHNRGYHTGYGSSSRSSSSSRSYGSSTYGSINQQQQMGQVVQDVEDPSQLQLGQQEDNSDLTQQVEKSGFGGQRIELGQQEDNSDLTQQVEDVGYGNFHRKSQFGQEIDDADLTQQVDNIGYGKLQFGSQQDNPELTQQVENVNFHQAQLGHQMDNSDLTQQIDTGYGKLQFGSQQDNSDLRQQAENIGHGNLHQQEIDNSDLTQQIEDAGYGKLQFGSQQQEDNSDLTQQVEDVGHLQQQQIDHSDLTQHIEKISNGKLEFGSQQQDNSDLTQQVEDAGHVNLNQLQLGQQMDQSDLTQQVENTGYGKLQFGSQQQEDNSDLTQQEDMGQVNFQHPQLGQQVDNSDLTQQVEEVGYGKLQFGSQQQDDSDVTQQVENVNLHHPQLGQQIDNSDLTQQVEEVGYGKLQFGSQQQDDSDLTQQVENVNLHHPQLGQQIDNSDLTQQVEDTGYGKLQFGSQQQDNSDLTQQMENVDNEHLHQQQINNFHLTQQVEGTGYGKLQLGSQLQEGHSDLTQQLSPQIDNGDLTQQQVGDIGYGKLGSQQHQHQSEFGQLEDNFDLTQQVEENGLGKLQLGSQQNQQQYELGQQEDNSDLTQQVEDHGLEKLQLGSQGNQQKSEFGQQKDELSQQQVLDSGFGTGQQEDDSDLTQQTEDTGFGKIQFGKQEQLDDDSQHIFKNAQGQRALNDNQQTGNSDLTEVDVPVEAVEQTRTNVAGKPQHEDDLTQQQVDMSENPSISKHNEENFTPDVNVQTPGTLPENKQVETQQVDVYQNIGGKSYKVTSQGHFFSQSQSRADAENEADLLIQKLRAIQKNQHEQTNVQSFGQNNGPATYPPTQGHGSHGGSEDSGSTQKFAAYLNQQQVNFAEQLENEFSKQLQDALDENQYVVTSSGYGSRIENSPSTRFTYQKLSEELQKNVTKQVQDIFNDAGQQGSSSYYHIVCGSLTNQQRENMMKQLQADLLLQLQEKLGYSSLHQQSFDRPNHRSHGGHHSTSSSHSTSHYSHTYSQSQNSYGKNSESYGYGHSNSQQGDYRRHPENIHNFKTSADVEELEPQHRQQVENVYSFSDAHPRVHSHGGYGSHSPNYRVHYSGGQQDYHMHQTPYPSGNAGPPPPPPPPPPHSFGEGHPPPEPYGIPPPPPPPHHLAPVPTDDGGPKPTENLPWWKRFGNSVKEGAHNLKEKIVGKN